MRTEETVSGVGSASSETASSVTVNDQSQQQTDIDERIVETEWSEPDSTGRQYAKRTRETQRKSRTHTDTDILTEAQSSVSDAEAVVISGHNESQTHNDIKASESISEQTRTPAWVLWLIGGVVLVVLVVVIVILKHYRII